MAPTQFRMSDEKQSASAPYPTIPIAPPPPSYNESVAGSSAPIIGVPLAAGVEVSGPVFSNLPAMRYDTMTSYVEDGSGCTVITTGAILDRPIMVQCPFCKTAITTETHPRSGCLTWLCCLALSALGLIYGCCLIPFCSKRLRDVEHICPKCHNLVAVYKRI